MKLTCTISHLANGKWLVRHTGSSTGEVEVTALTREAALTKMRDELQYRIEWRPCSGASRRRVSQPARGRKSCQRRGGTSLGFADQGLMARASQARA